MPDTDRIPRFSVALLAPRCCVESSTAQNASNRAKLYLELFGVLTLILSRVFFFALFLLAVYAVQRFWFVRAWSWIGSFSNANWRFGLHAGLIALAAALLATLLDPLLGR